MRRHAYWRLGGIAVPIDPAIRYVEANFEMKEKALAGLDVPAVKLRRFRGSDDLMKFLRSL